MENISVGTGGRVYPTSQKLELPSWIHPTELSRMVEELVSTTSRGAVVEELVSTASRGAVSKQTARCPGVCKARQQAAREACPVPSQPQPHSVLAFVSGSTQRTRRMKADPGWWWAARNKVPNPHSLLVPPALFSKNGQPAEGLCNFWWAWQMACWLGHIKPSTDTNLPWRGTPAPSALGCGAQRRMGSDPNRCQLPQQPWPARPRGDARAHTPVGGFSQGSGSVGSPTPPHPIANSSQDTLHSPWHNRPCSASLLLPLISGSWSLENHFQSTYLGVFSLSATKHPAAFIPFADE